MLLVVVFSPGDVQLFAGVHQHTHTWKEVKRPDTQDELPEQIFANSPANLKITGQIAPFWSPECFNLN